MIRITHQKREVGNKKENTMEERRRYPRFSTAVKAKHTTRRDVNKDKQRFKRFSTHLKAKYYLEENAEQLKECIIFNMSRMGMGIEFYEKTNVGSTITMMIPITGESKTIIVKGTIRWIQQRWIRGRGNDFIGGIELTDVLDESTLDKLCPY